MVVEGSSEIAIYPRTTTNTRSPSYAIPCHVVVMMMMAMMMMCDGTIPFSFLKTSGARRGSVFRTLVPASQLRFCSLLEPRVG